MTESASAQLDETVAIVAAYVANNTVSASELPGLIAGVRAALQGPVGAAAAPAGPTPAVPIKKSITPDFLISLEDGKRFKSLKRYLATSHGMTPDDYRRKWGLPGDYPMVAPNYAATRSALARNMGLGRSRAKPAPAPAAAPKPAPMPKAAPAAKPEPVAEAPKGRGRPRKAA